ncbi:MAG: hypothetical protein V3R99_05465 [Thermoguttaceae bacterium]
MGKIKENHRLGRLTGTLLTLSVALLLAGCPAGDDTSSGTAATDGISGLKTPTLAVTLPIEHHTPDGLALDPKTNDLLLACPNFNETAEAYPAWIMKITPEDKLEKYFELPPHPDTGKACPLGIAFGSDGNLYIADSQGLGGDENYKSRLLKLTIEDGKPVKCESVVEGFVVSNAVACFGDSVYVTETRFEPSPPAPAEGEVAPPPGPLASGVYRFDISELDPDNPIQLEKGGTDPHVICTIKTISEEWQVGANGLGFATDGTMYVCNFGDAQLIEVKLDADGKEVAQKVLAEGDPIESTDGLKVDPQTGLIYIADFLGNAVHCVDPKTGDVTVIAKNGDTDGTGGLLDKCSEVGLRDGKIYVSNIDLPFDGNTFDEPYTISVIELDPAQ